MSSVEKAHCVIAISCKRLTCAFTQSCLEALQETVEEQFPSGQTGRRWSRRTVTLPPFTSCFCWIAAARQWTDGKMSLCRFYTAVTKMFHQQLRPPAVAAGSDTASLQVLPVRRQDVFN